MGFGKQNCIIRIVRVGEFYIITKKVPYVPERDFYNVNI